MVREMRRNGRQSSRWRGETVRAGNGGALRAHGMGQEEVGTGGRERKRSFFCRLAGTALCGGLPRCRGVLARPDAGKGDARNKRRNDALPSAGMDRLLKSVLY